MELMVGRFGKVDARCPDEDESDCTLLGELIPQLQGPVAVGRAEAADEVVFICLDGAFGCVDAMVC